MEKLAEPSSSSDRREHPTIPVVPLTMAQLVGMEPANDADATPAPHAHAGALAGVCTCATKRS